MKIVFFILAIWVGLSAVSPSEGIPSRAVGINSVTECAVPSEIPSTYIRGRNSIIGIDNMIFSFGGEALDEFGNRTGGAPNAYKYDLTTDTWTPISNLNQPRFSATTIRMSAKEILIAGTPLAHPSNSATSHYHIFFLRINQTKSKICTSHFLIHLTFQLKKKHAKTFEENV